MLHPVQVVELMAGLWAYGLHHLAEARLSATLLAHMSHPVQVVVVLDSL
jgi:hypothetical protein